MPIVSSLLRDRNLREGEGGVGAWVCSAGTPRMYGAASPWLFFQVCCGFGEHDVCAKMGMQGCGLDSGGYCFWGMFWNRRTSPDRAYALLLLEKRLVLLLGFDESLLEEVGVCKISSVPHVIACVVVFVGKLTLAVAETNGKGLSLRLALGDICRGVPNPRAVTADVGGELHVGDNVVVGADLQGLVTAHDESGSAVLLVLQQADLSSSAFLPLS